MNVTRNGTFVITAPDGSTIVPGDDSYNGCYSAITASGQYGTFTISAPGETVQVNEPPPPPPPGQGIASLPGLKSWTWGGENGENVTHTGGSTPRITRLENLADSSNPYVNDTGSNQPGYEPNGISVSGYSTNLPVIAVDRYNNGSQAYRQTLDQARGLNASGDFYVAFACLNVRDAGERFVLGTQGGDYLRLSQNSNYLEIAFNGSEAKITPRHFLGERLIVEVWRESGTVYCRVNGQMSGVTLSRSQTFDLKGFGGGNDAGGSAWDDYCFEWLACDQLPSQADRDAAVAELNGRWNLF